ncbi:MAG TPA: ATP-dependent Clp protease ATP-binding subunit ClpX [Myxococcota bacterium]|nr:ATP-dependent Clp protease ATP-binding subunit ClpX [Myxococcota bacterium]
MPKYSSPASLSCSFCHKPQRDVEKIIAGPNVYICNECIRLCLDIIRENRSPTSGPLSGGKTPTPARIKAYMDQYVVGQDSAKRKIAVAVYNHYKRLEVNAKNGAKPSDVEIQKSNVLLIGPTGTGKTLIAQTLARMLDVPFVVADATTLTEAGYVGEDVENIILNLYHASGNNIEKTQKGIVYIDEVDKIAKKAFTSSVSRDVSGEGVQQALLKILEGATANIQVKGNKRLPNQEYLQIDTANILFICGGSFEGMERIIQDRMGRKLVGFGVDRGDASEAARPESALRHAVPEDLEKFGLIPEFIGRLPVTAVLNPLGAEDLMHVLTEPRNSVVKQYQKLFKFEKVKLTFTTEALRAIATKAVSRKAGARGLRTIMENVMLDVMYELPSQDNVKEVVITEDVVMSKTAPRTEPLRGTAG